MYLLIRCELVRLALRAKMINYYHYSLANGIKMDLSVKMLRDFH